MSRTLISPEAILPTRMTLRVSEETDIQFSVLQFPYAQALDKFMERFKHIYERQNDELLPFSMRPPWRQLNDAILALAPGLIQAFEGDDEKHSRMIAFTQYGDNNNPKDIPTLEQLQSLIRHWLERWGEQKDVKPILQGDGQAAWQELLNAFRKSPETQWQHGITPADLIADPRRVGGLAYVALPALLSALLHDQAMTLLSEKGEYPITWRRANDGGKNGLHIVSNPLRYGDDYFAYRLDFSVQTQAGYVNEQQDPKLWIFTHVSIQRYMAQQVRSTSNENNISVLVGFNRDQFVGGWDYDSTLINLAVKHGSSVWQWDSGVGDLLDSFSMRSLLAPNDLFTTPQNHGNFTALSGFDEDEYYIVYAEGRKFGDEHGRKHQVKTGTSLRERSQIIEGVLLLLRGWLQDSPPLQKDAQQNPSSTFALRNYDYMVADRQDRSKQQASWRKMLKTSLNSSDKSHMHLVVLYRSESFRDWAEKQLTDALMGVDKGEEPLVTVSYMEMQPMLYVPFDAGELPYDYMFLPREEKTREQKDKWRKLMREGYATKRDQWREFLRQIDWHQDSRRLLLIDSTGESEIHENRKIKGAVRDACHREGILTQFIVGDNLRLDRNPRRADKLDGESSGKLQNAVLDLLVRQQGILYAAPSEIYERAAELDSELANQLDVITFCRVSRTSPRFKYVLAVRLRANGEVAVLLPSDSKTWLPYDVAAHTVGQLLSKERANLVNPKANSVFRMKHEDMLNFAHDVLLNDLECPTIAVIEAEDWRNARGKDEQRQCWTQLQNGALYKHQSVLHFDSARTYQRNAPRLEHLLGVIRLRMNGETPQYVTTDTWADEELMRDIPHLTGYVDPCVTDLLHYFSIAGLSETQKKQNEASIMELFRGDLKTNQRHDIAYKHAQMIEMVPFFVHPGFDSDLGRRKLCRCVHFLRISPALAMGGIVLPYPMHLGEKLIEDQLTIIKADA